MAPITEPRSAWPFLISSGVTAPIRATVVPSPVEGREDLLSDWTAQHPALNATNRRPHRVTLPDGSPAWMAFLRRTASSDAVVRLWSPAAGTLSTLEGHVGRVTACAFSPDESLLATASWDRTVRIWSTATGTTVAVLAGHEAWVAGVTFTPDGRRVLTSSWDGAVRAFDLTGGPAVAVWTMSAPLVNGCAITPDGTTIVSAGADHLVRIIDATRPGTAAKHLLEGHAADITVCALSPDGTLLATGARDNRVVLWTRDGVKQAEFSDHDDWISGLAFAADGSWYSAAWDGRIIHRTRGRRPRNLVHHTDRLTACAVNPDQSLVLAPSADGVLRAWAPATGAEVFAGRVGRGTISSCAVSPTARYVALSGLDDVDTDADTAAGTARDSAGRTIQLLEGLLMAGDTEPAPLLDRDLAHLHALALSGLGRYIATEPYGGDTTTSPTVTLPAWTPPIS